MMLSTPSANPLIPSRTGILAGHLTEAGWLGLLITVPLVMNVAAARTFEAAKLAAAAPMAALLLFALIAAVIARAAWLPHGAGKQPALWAFAALTSAAIVATVFSETPWIAFFGDYFRREGLVSWLIYATVFAALMLTMRERGQLERVADALLLVSIVPCVYGLQQRYGYDFFSTAGLLGGTAGARPGSNLGNPTFLSAYLLLIIPLTVARLINTAGTWPVRAPWLALLALQLFAAILTQSRGPLLGLVATLFLLAVTLGSILKIRSLIFTALGVGVITIAALAALNLVPDLQGMVKNTPFQRFIFTGGQDLTANSRIGIWTMGADAFIHQPLWRQIIGSGADSTHFNYFPHLPSWVMRIEGLTETIDRLHGESMETAMTLGLAGLLAQLVLLSSLVWMVAARVGRFRGVRAPLVFAFACGVLLLAGGLGLMWALGSSRGLFGVGAGLGIALAWSATLVLAAWNRTADGNGISARADTVLAVALVCALIGSWIEVQVGVPTISTRLLAATYAALIILLCINALEASTGTGSARDGATDGPAAPESLRAPATAAPVAVARKRKRTKADARDGAALAGAAAARQYRPTLAGWVTGLALMVITAAYFPPLSGAVIHPPSPQRLHLIIVPMMWLIAAGAVVAWYETRRTGTAAIDAVTRFLVWMALPWFAFVVAYAQLGGALRGAGDAHVGERINALLMFSFGSYALMTVALGLALYFANPLRRAAAGTVDTRARSSRSSLTATIVLVVGAAAGAATYWAAMIDVRADTYAKLATWALSHGRADAANVFHKQAADLLPQERRFAGSHAARLVERAAQDLSALPSNPALAPIILARLDEAEKSIARSRLAAPRDPWVTFAYANVKQFRGIGVLEPYLPKGEREKNVAAAREHFALARQQFPGHPWLLRNWAQLEIDQGNRAAAYKMFDEMEQLDPLNTGLYSERLRFTRAFGDHSIAITALRKGIAAQPAGSPGETALKHELARYFQQTGQMQQAVNEWLDMLRTHPDEVEAAVNAAETYAQMGQRDLASGNAHAALARIAAMPRSAATDRVKARLDTLIARLQATSGAGARPASAPAIGAAASAPPASAAGAPPAARAPAPAKR